MKIYLVLIEHKSKILILQFRSHHHALILVHHHAAAHATAWSHRLHLVHQQIGPSSNDGPPIKSEETAHNYEETINNRETNNSHCSCILFVLVSLCLGSWVVAVSWVGLIQTANWANWSAELIVLYWLV